MSKNSNLPPLNALKTFEVTARLLSFKKAAVELCLTPSAVSHQIKLLEEDLGEKLFERHHRCIKLTKSGKEYFEDIEVSFSVLDKATVKLKQSSKKTRITVLIGKGKYFLQPLLDEYQLENSEVIIEIIRISEVDVLKGIDYSQKAYDVALLWGSGVWQGLEPVKLFDSQLGIFAAPQVIKDKLPLQDLSVLQDYPLIHDSMYPATWAWWQKNSGIDNFISNGENIFVAGVEERIAAALGGQGVIFVDKYIVQHYVDEGSLINLSENYVKGLSYYLAKNTNVKQKEVDYLFNWLSKEIKSRVAD